MATASTTKPDTKAKSTKKTGKVRALERGYYDGRIYEEGETFENTLDITPRDEEPADKKTVWFENVDAVEKTDDTDKSDLA